MTALPPSVAAYVTGSLLPACRLAYLQVDARGCVRTCGGALAHYGLEGIAAGLPVPVEDHTSFLFGLLPAMAQPMVLRAVRVEQGACADVHLWAADDSSWVLLLDGSADHDQRQIMQQKGNELSLHSERQSRVLEAHVGRPIVEGLLEGRWHVRTGGERRHVTILFADIRDFTPYCEASDPAEVFGSLNQYMPALLEPVEAYGGIVDKIIGDAVMAVFGLDVGETAAAGGGACGQALRAARDILRRVNRVNRERGHAGQRVLGVGVGVATGAVAVGVIGSQARRGFTAIGHHVNIAARLQGIAAAGEIYADRTTVVEAGMAATDFVSTTVSLKGVRDTMQAYVCRTYGSGRDNAP